jgi:site-specific DNA-methyltransferase (adenine-specific)
MTEARRRSRRPAPTGKLITGDCIVGMQAQPAGTVDLAFADPPFNIGYKYDEYDDKRTEEDYLKWAQEWLTEVFRVLRPHGSFWMAIGPKYVSELDVIAKGVGFKQRAHVAWYYTFGVNCTKTFTPSKTHLLYYTKAKTKFTFNADEVRTPSARQTEYADPRANPDGRLPDDTWILRPQEVPAAFKASEDCWHIPRIAGTFKQRAEGAANQMPEQVLGRIIRACSNAGELVLDPFAGTATTLAVAKKLGRQYIGFELSETYAANGRNRVDAAHVGQPLDGPLPQGG